jgi:site-specific recombinase XerD
VSLGLESAREAAGAAAAKPGRPLPPAWEAREPPRSWWQTCQPRDRVLERLQGPPFVADNPTTQRTRQRGLTKLLGWLAEQPGQAWQERWLASGAEDARREWVRLPLAWLTARQQARPYDRADLCCGMIPLLGGQVVRPTYQWLLRQQPAQLLAHLRRFLDPEGFAALEAHCEATGRGGVQRQAALNRLTWILTAKGGLIGDITVGDCAELLHALDEHQSNGQHGRHLFYALLAETGVLPPGAPPRLKAVLLPGQRSAAQLIDRHHLAGRPVRDLLVAYLTERAVDWDYVTLEPMANMLGSLFWRDLERHHPGIDTLRLTPAIAAAWKDRVRFVWDGQGRKVRPRVNVHTVLTTVRAFYQDLARWAAEDPARWGPWVAPCPIRASECTHEKARARRRASMDQRTRTLLPVLPTLVQVVDRQRHAAQERLAAGRDALVGAVVAVGGERFRRRGGASERVYVTDLTTDKRRDLTAEEEQAFWTWAIVEVLRHTGIRVEELLELTHHSFVASTLPTTGEVVPMLQVAPSKLDQERLLLVSPELGEVLTAVIYRVRAGRAALPLVSAYDRLERTWSASMPFLFQRRHGPEHRAIPRNYLRKCLGQALAGSGLTDASGQPLQFTAHDLRRIWVTDAIRSGLPPHIAAKICGHRLLDTTMGYAAIYPEDVIGHHRAFIARRRALRPSQEYRDLTPEEWDEFLGHFELRKVALGICTRDYGTPCVHENACVRCPLLRPDPAQLPRLEEIRANLTDRLQEAKEQGWLGEVAAIETTLAAADQKLAAMRELATRHTATYLGMPDFRPAAGRASPHTPPQPDTPMSNTDR